MPSNPYRRALLAVGLALCGNALYAASDSAATARATLDKYCIGCHNQKLKTAGLTLDTADLTKAAGQGELWEKIILKLKLGMMPPPGLPRPGDSERLAVVQYLRTELDRAAIEHPN